jgi:hypothetical protein
MGKGTQGAVVLGATLTSTGHKNVAEMTERPGGQSRRGRCFGVNAVGHGGGRHSTVPGSCHGDGRHGDPLSLSSSSDGDDDEFTKVVGGGSPCCSRSRHSSLCCSRRRSRRRILLSFLRAARSCSRRCAAWATARAWGVGGSDREASTVTLC